MTRDRLDEIELGQRAAWSLAAENRPSYAHRMVAVRIRLGAVRFPALTRAAVRSRAAGMPRSGGRART
jgi:hypothetical protein